VPDAILDRGDKTVFGEHLPRRLRRHATLHRRPRASRRRQLPRLAERLDQGGFTLWEYCWARDLTSAHAFLANW
jgi:hypothetical protein